MRKLVSSLIIILAFIGGNVYASSQCDRFDKTFRAATIEHMPVQFEEDWRYIKAVAITESGCRPKVCSKSGACGVMQVMKGTWKDIHKGQKAYTLISNPHDNIHAGTKYLSMLANRWLAEGIEKQYVLDIAIASYHAGFRNVRDARDMCKIVRDQADTWNDIKRCLPFVTSKDNAKVTVKHVSKVKKHLRALEEEGVEESRGSKVSRFWRD